MYSGKLITNEFTRSGSSSSTVSSTSISGNWYAPSDGTRTNRVKTVGEQAIVQNITGTGILFSECNGGALSATGTATTTTDNAGAPLAVTRYTYPVQRDTGY